MVIAAIYLSQSLFHFSKPSSAQARVGACGRRDMVNKPREELLLETTLNFQKPRQKFNTYTPVEPAASSFFSGNTRFPEECHRNRIVFLSFSARKRQSILHPACFLCLFGSNTRFPEGHPRNRKRFWHVFHENASLFCILPASSALSLFHLLVGGFSFCRLGVLLFGLGAAGTATPTFAFASGGTAGHLQARTE